MSFGNKVVLVTGASSGIGADCARHFAKLGANVVLVGRNEKRLNEIVDFIKQTNSPTPLAIVADVTKDAQRIVDETIKQFGKLNVLVNNAGIVIQDNVVDAKLSEFDRVFDTNVRSIITLTQLCVAHLEKTKGNVVNVSSVAGLKAVKNVMTYCMSKAALDQFTKCAALDLAPKGIRVNAINPAAIRTPIFQTVGLTTETTEQLFEHYKTHYPVGRVGEVSDTSAAISFLADDKSASFLTGCLLPVDGGCMTAGSA